MKEIRNVYFVNTAAFTVAVWLLLMLGCTNTALAQKPANILVVSVDALVPEALGDNTSPFISGLMRQGVYSLDGMSVAPPLTLVSHSAMVTGLSPEQGGRLDNGWHPDEPTVPGETIFHAAKNAGYGTGFFYAKQKLGYLVNTTVDTHELSAFPTDKALQFVRQGNSFTFVHISGLDQVGSESGWRSKEYLEELSYIDEFLKPLVEEVRLQGEYCIIILADHGGHERLHGCSHPENFKIPVIVLQSHPAIKPIDLRGFTTDDLPTLVAKVLTK